METVLVALLTVLGGSALIMLIVLLSLRGMVRKRLRVAAKQRSVAPSSWALGVSQAARVHRRLRTATQRARLEAARPGTQAAELRAVVAQIERHAVNVEHDLVSASQAARGRRRAALSAPTAEVVRIEAHVEHLATVSRQWQAALADEQLGHPLQMVDDRLNAAGHAARVVTPQPPLQPEQQPQAPQHQPQPQPFS